MPSASSSTTGGTTAKTGKQGSKAKNNKRANPSNNKLPVEDEANLNIATDEPTNISSTKNDQVCQVISTKSSKGASTTAVATDEQTQQSGLGTPISSLETAMTFLEHKIRNMEKRKAKLDSYKAEQSNGKQLNTDQLQAVSKYSELKSQLEFAKETDKTFKEIMENFLTALKKQETQAAVERMRASLERTKSILIFASILRELRSEDTRRDFTEGTNGAVKLTEEQMNCLNELQTATLDTNLSDDNNLAITADRFANLLDEQPKVLCGSMTYKDAKNLLVELSNSEYFKSASAMERARLKKEAEEKEKAALDAQNLRTLEEPSSEATETFATLRAESFNYAREAHMDLTPVDPAVVAVSYIAPPVSHENSASRFIPVSRPDQHQGHTGLLSHGGQGDVNLNNLTLKSEESIDNWTNLAPKPNQEWSNLREGTINAGLNESDGMDYEFQSRRFEGDRTQYQNRGRQQTTSVNNGYRGSPSQYQRPGGNTNGKSNDSAFDGRPRYERADNVHDVGRQMDRGGRGSRQVGFGNRNDAARSDGAPYMNQRYPMQGGARGGGRGGGSFRGNGGGMFQ